MTVTARPLRLAVSALECVVTERALHLAWKARRPVTEVQSQAALQHPLLQGTAIEQHSGEQVLEPLGRNSMTRCCRVAK